MCAVIKMDPVRGLGLAQNLCGQGEKADGEQNQNYVQPDSEITRNGRIHFVPIIIAGENTNTGSDRTSPGSALTWNLVCNLIHLRILIEQDLN
jgi:hypothetical protein